MSDVKNLPAAVESVYRKFKETLDLSLFEGALAGLVDAYHALVETFAEHGVLYICGNGGSFADAIHIKGELAKSFCAQRPVTDEKLRANLRNIENGAEIIDNLEAGLPVVVLGESGSLSSAYANDRDPKYVYAQELNSFAAHIKPGVFLGISTSGNAGNVNVAMTLAKAYQMTTIAFTGSNGGQLARQADITWKMPENETYKIQELQLRFYHVLCLMVEARFYLD